MSICLIIEKSHFSVFGTFRPIGAKNHLQVSGIESVKTNHLPFWICFIVCKIHHASKDSPKMVQIGT